MSVKLWLTIFLLLGLIVVGQSMYASYSSNSRYIEYTTHFEFLDTPIWVNLIVFVVFVAVGFFPRWGLVKFSDDKD